jgi:hypothetical protein
MPRRPPTHFRPSLADTKRGNQAALDFLRASSYREDAPRIDVGAGEKRERGPINAAESEAPVLRAVGQLLARHPNVLVALRMNSGAAVNAAGQPVKFHRLVRGRGVVTDYVGWLREPLVPFAIECKRPAWRPGKAYGETKLREEAQGWFIAGCVDAGGRGGFVRSVDEALTVVGER